MKSFFSNKILILLVRVFLGGLFIVSGLDKIVDAQAFAISILNYKIVGTTLATLTATILPSLELLCGLSLILGLYPRTSALLIVMMLVGFTVLVASALFRGLDISCGCFTQDGNASKIGYQKILENGGMILLGVWLVLVPNSDVDLIRFLRKPKS
jgi:uncharacterized membrane protein YphA (DoxX/SURF4 family)